jgi:hypothetical protein
MTTTKDDVSNNDKPKKLHETLQSHLKSLVNFSETYFHAEFAPSDSGEELVLPSLDGKQKKILEKVAKAFRCFFKRHDFACNSLDVFEDIQSCIYYAEVKARKEEIQRKTGTKGSYSMANDFGYVYSIYWMQFFIECSDASQELRIFLKSFKSLYPVAAFDEKNFPVSYCEKLYEDGVEKAKNLEYAESLSARTHQVIDQLATSCVANFVAQGVPSAFFSTQVYQCQQEGSKPEQPVFSHFGVNKA